MAINRVTTPAFFMPKGGKLKMKNYYAVAGVNAFAIFDNYEKALESRKYIKKQIIKKADDFYVAFNVAINIYNDYQSGDQMAMFRGSFTDVSANWVYHRKWIAIRNLKGGEPFVHHSC